MPKGRSAKKQGPHKTTLKNFFSAARVYEEAAGKIKQIGAAKAEAQQILTDHLLATRQKSLTNDEGTTVTLVHPEVTTYDADGIWNDLTARQRPHAFDRVANFGNLPAERRKELDKLLLEALTPAERRKVFEHRLNEEKLARAVQAERISVDLVAKHTTITHKAPSVRISHGAG